MVFQAAGACGARETTNLNEGARLPKMDARPEQLPGPRPAQFMSAGSLPMRSPVASLATAAMSSCVSSKSKIPKFDAM